MADIFNTILEDLELVPRPCCADSYEARASVVSRNADRLRGEGSHKWEVDPERTASEFECDEL